MKTVILALLVLLVFSHGEALRCNCGGTSKICTSRVETCSGPNQVCASITISAGSVINHFRSCYRESDCSRLINSPFASGRCCKTDLCN